MPTRKPSTPKAPRPKFTVIRDTREKPGHGWTFAKTVNCLGTVSKKLDTGDYSLVGLEGVVTVDRKGCISEFAGNLTQPRFERELERMAPYKMAAVVLEFEYDDLHNWPRSAGIPASKRRYIRTDGTFLLKRLIELHVRFPNVWFLFAGVHGQSATLSFLKRAWAEYGPAPKADDGPSAAAG